MSHQHEEPTPGMVILAVSSEMLRQRLDTLGEKSYLHLGGACVLRVEAVGRYDGLSLLFDEHRPPARRAGRSFPLSYLAESIAQRYGPRKAAAIY